MSTSDFPSTILEALRCTPLFLPSKTVFDIWNLQCLEEILGKRSIFEMSPTMPSFISFHLPHLVQFEKIILSFTWPFFYTSNFCSFNYNEFPKVKKIQYVTNCHSKLCIIALLICMISVTLLYWNLSLTLNQNLETSLFIKPGNILYWQKVNGKEVDIKDIFFKGVSNGIQ